MRTAIRGREVRSNPLQADGTLIGSAPLDCIHHVDPTKRTLWRPETTTVEILVFLMISSSVLGL